MATGPSKLVSFTVIPVYSDHPRETQKVVFEDRWSLCTGSFSTCTCFNEIPFSRETKNVVFLYIYMYMYIGGH